MPDVSRSPAPSSPPSIPLPHTWKFYKEFLQATERSNLSLSLVVGGWARGALGASLLGQPCAPASPVMLSTTPTLGVSRFQADLMKPSLQMKPNSKGRRVVGRLGMMYACSCSLAAVSLITTDANEMLPAYGDRESSRTPHQSTLYLGGGWEGGMRARGLHLLGLVPVLSAPIVPCLVP